MSAAPVQAGSPAYKVPFLEAIKIRRSVHSLSKSSPIPDDRIVLIVNHAIKHAPSPFHVQSCRAIVLFGDEHDKLWDIGLQRTKETVPPEVFANLEDKINGFRAAYGTVLFFEDSSAVEKLPPPFQALSSKNPEWFEQSNAMNQFIAWTALATEGLGCNLQHYHAIIGKAVAEIWKVPQTWRLRAELVFGTPSGPPRGGVEKQFAPLEGRVQVYGDK
ncbi:nitroreductase HBN [Hyphodiscus hymeniophilus]|uniref:Nitroreductase HBN n=1 Tax=Hyphodiscus hymeniophilus TaxID=353542 RepID=A0A9P6VPU3_9HELO|nr:nitroreductase HBN [Hyphodiscus hymeniophilus]